MDRRALVIGSWLTKGRDRPSPQKILSITTRWDNIFKDNSYGFRSLTNKSTRPTSIQNPDLTKLTSIFENASNVVPETELLLVFIGHSTVSGTNDLNLILGTNKAGKDRTIRLSLLLQNIESMAGIRKLILVLDTCHSGIVREQLALSGLVKYAMFASGSAYAYDANFSEGVLRAFEDDLKRNDQRIDRKAGGVTYKKIFESARSYVLGRIDPKKKDEYPNSHGDYIGEVLLEAPIVIPESYNPFASERSVYGRIFNILNSISENSNITRAELYRILRIKKEFLLKGDGDDGSVFVSNDRLDEYMSFLRRSEWVVEPNGKLEITYRGKLARSFNKYNKHILDAIENKVLGGEIDFEYLDGIVSELLDDMIPPTPIKIKDRAGMKGAFITLDPPTRIALQILPSTGRFLKGASDAIFPSERGGA